jgi:polyhydroxybutyrate depolymerase
MRKTIFIFAILSLAVLTNVSALWTNKTMTYGGLTRSYRVFQSANYNASIPASLLIALHGLGDNMTNFSGIGFHNIADTANIIVIYPQAVTDPLMGSSAWNSGAGAYGYYPNSSVNDIGFINAIIDTAIVKYSIDRSRIYLCGFSMGGFMTERMAIQSNYRIAAFASMSGTIGSGVTPLNPGRHVPIAHFHGTSDSTVFYAGNLYGMDADSLVKFWVNKNGCNPVPATDTFPDIVSDGISVERFKYSGSDSDAEVWFYKISGMEHTVLYRPANDLSEIVEVWGFLRRHTLANAVIENNNYDPQAVQVFPNPAKTWVTVTGLQQKENCTLSLFNLQGQLILQKTVNEETMMLDLGGLVTGIYLVKVSNSNYSTVRKIVIE